MTTWIIKFATDDPDRALANVQDQRSKGYTWIEDGNRAAVDEQSLKMIGRGVDTRHTLIDRLTGPLFVVGGVLAGFLFFT
jgi:hypothetical protein